MEQEVEKTLTRDDFIKYINDTLVGKGFIKDSENDFWIKDTQIRQGGGMMIINGQKQEMPGEIRNIKQMIEVYGEGSIKDVNTEVESKFIHINFDIEENEMKEDLGPTLCLFYDDQQLFNYILNKTFGI